jgi:hypothetical protein
VNDLAGGASRRFSPLVPIELWSSKIAQVEAGAGSILGISLVERLSIGIPAKYRATIESRVLDFASLWKIQSDANG